jgi:hypothetical protein
MKLAVQKIVFRKTLEKNHPEKSEAIWSDTEIEFARLKSELIFIKTSKNPMDARLESAALFLALIKSMKMHSFDFTAIRSACLQVAEELVRPKSSFQLFMKKLTARVVLTSFVQRILKRKIAATRTPVKTPGFVVEYVAPEKDKFLFGLDITECGICKLFKKGQMEEYAKILCEVDFITSEIAGLQLIRSNTIANGGKKCDFRFARKKD